MSRNDGAMGIGIARAVTTVVVWVGLLTFASDALSQPLYGGSCDDVTSSSLYGLCHAYCDALDCEGGDPRGSGISCERLLQAYTRRSDGELPPCVLPEGYECLPEGFALPTAIDVERVATGAIITLDLEEYLKGVLPREVGTSFDMAALEAQAIASRSYAVRWILDGRGPICDTASCQVYGDVHYDVTDQAVENTRGAVGWYDGEVIRAYFHPSSGGHTTAAVDLGWPGEDYLVAVSDLENAICTEDCNAWYPVDEPLCERNWAEGCCFGRFQFGHGVGMSQQGARAMAMCGYDHVEILTHYYQGISIAVPCED